MLSYSTYGHLQQVICRMLQDSGLLHEEPVKLFSDAHTAQTKTHTTKSSSSSHNKTSNSSLKRAPYSKANKLPSSQQATTSCSNRTQLSMKRSPDEHEVCSTLHYCSFT